MRVERVRRIAATYISGRPLLPLRGSRPCGAFNLADRRLGSAPISNPNVKKRPSPRFRDHRRLDPRSIGSATRISSPQMDEDEGKRVRFFFAGRPLSSSALGAALARRLPLGMDLRRRAPGEPGSYKGANRVPYFDVNRLLTNAAWPGRLGHRRPRSRASTFFGRRIWPALFFPATPRLSRGKKPGRY